MSEFSVHGGRPGLGLCGQSQRLSEVTPESETLLSDPSDDVVEEQVGRWARGIWL